MDNSEENRLVEFAKKGFEKISHLAESQKISDKLIGFNGLLATITAAILITNNLVPMRDFLTYMIILVVLCFVSFAGMVLYVPFLELLSHFVEDKIASLRTSIYFLLLSLLFATADALFNLILLRQIAIAFLGIQILIIPFGFMLPKSGIEDVEIPPSKMWDYLGKVATLWGIVEMILFVASAIISFIK